MSLHSYLLFVGASLLLVLAPGPDMAYLLGRSIAQGKRTGVRLNLATCERLRETEEELADSALMMLSATGRRLTSPPVGSSL